MVPASLCILRRAVGADEQVFVRARENAMQSHNRSRLGAAVGRASVKHRHRLRERAGAAPRGVRQRAGRAVADERDVQRTQWRVDSDEFRVAHVAVPDRGAQ